MRTYIISLALLAIGYLNNNIEVNSLKTENSPIEEKYKHREPCSNWFKKWCKKHCYPRYYKALCYEKEYNYCNCVDKKDY